MLEGIRYFISLSALAILMLGTQAAQSGEVGKGTYLCSVNIRLNEKVIVDIKNQTTDLFKVAKNESDWTAYHEVFVGLNKTIQKKLMLPTYFTLRLIPDYQSGKQNLDLEMSVQTYNRFSPSKMEPMTSVSVSAKYSEFAVKYQTPNRYKIDFSCSKS